MVYKKCFQDEKFHGQKTINILIGIELVELIEIAK